MAEPSSEISQETHTVVNSSIVVPASTESQPLRKRQNDEQTDRSDKKEEESQKRPRLDMSQDGQRRGKRMFGVLMGTLNKFKTETSNKTSAERQREQIVNKLQEKLERERSELADRVKREKEEHLERVQERKRQSKLEITQKVELTNAKHRVYLSKFIKTKTEPQLLFRPGKLTDIQSEQISAQEAKANEDLDSVIRKHKEENGSSSEKAEDEKMDEVKEETKADAKPNGDTKEDVNMNGTDETSVTVLPPVEASPPSAENTIENHTSDEIEQRGDVSSQNGDVVDYEGEP